MMQIYFDQAWLDTYPKERRLCVPKRKNRRTGLNSKKYLSESKTRTIEKNKHFCESRGLSYAVCVFLKIYPWRFKASDYEIRERYLRVICWYEERWGKIKVQ